MSRVEKKHSPHSSLCVYKAFVLIMWKTHLPVLENPYGNYRRHGCGVSSVISGEQEEPTQNMHMQCISFAMQKKEKKTPKTKQTPPPTHIRSVSSSKKQLWGTQTVKSTPSQIKPDCNNETPQLTSLRHNKHCFDMVLNIPFPQARAHTNTAIYCVKPSRRHVTASCSLATCLTQTIGPT